MNSKKVKDDGNDVDENDPLPTNTPNGNTKVHQLYEMLYTGDKMKKLKKWMDGTLRMDQVTMMGTFMADDGEHVLTRRRCRW